MKKNLTERRNVSPDALALKAALLGFYLCMPVLALQDEGGFDVQALFTSSRMPVIYFLDTHSGDRVQTLEERGDGGFAVVVEGVQARQEIVDTVYVILTTDSGDEDIIPVIETADASSIYISENVSYAFTSKANKGNHMMEGRLDEDAAENRMHIMASAHTGSGVVFSQLSIRSAYVPVDSAWVADGNSDGQADALIIRFKRPLPYPPSEISSIDWPEEGGNNYSAQFNAKAGLNEISFLPVEDGVFDSTIIMVVLDEDEFRPGDTRISEAFPASITLPDDHVFRWQSPLLADRVNPVIAQATLLPVKIRSDEEIGPDDIISDTLFITFTEKLVAVGQGGFSWDSLLGYSSHVTGEVYPVTPSAVPVPTGPDSLSWKIVMSARLDHIPLLGNDEVFIIPSAPFRDRAGNTPGIRRDVVEGKGSGSVIAGIFLYPGLNAFNLQVFSALTLPGISVHAEALQEGPRFHKLNTAAQSSSDEPLRLVARTLCSAEGKENITNSLCADR